MTLLVLVMTMPIIFDVLLGFPLIVRVGATVGLLTIPGVLMGMPFPLGLSVVSQFGDSIIPWVYGVNAVASVLGTILVILVAMKLGFTVAIVLASVLYLAALILLLPLLARSSTSLSLNRGDM